MDTYAIELDQYGAYQVRVTKPDGGVEIVPGFPTWSDAQGWINVRVRRQTTAKGRSSG